MVLSAKYFVLLCLAACCSILPGRHTVFSQEVVPL